MAETKQELTKLSDVLKHTGIAFMSIGYGLGNALAWGGFINTALQTCALYTGTIGLVLAGMGAIMSMNKNWDKWYIDTEKLFEKLDEMYIS